MKKHINIFASFALAALALPLFSSCEGDKAEPPMPLPEGIFNQNGVIGEGTWQVPLTAYQVRIGTLPKGMSDNVWMSGYIVGWVNSNISATLKPENAVFSAPASVKSNLLLSDYDPEELEKLFVVKDENGNVVEDTRWEHCAPVNLNYDINRQALNLGDNPGNLGRRNKEGEYEKLSIMGETNLYYFGVYGMKNTSYYNWGPQGKYVAPAVPGTFKLTDTFTAGKWYLIVAQGNRAARVLSAERGYLAYTELTVINNQATLANQNNNAFYFENADYGFVRLRQSDGTYLCTDGNDIAFHITTDPNSPATLFSVAVEADGSAVIKAKSNGARMMYDTQYNSYGLYTTITAQHVAPVLFVK